MIGHIDNENALKELVASGLFPCIKRAMQKYEEAPDGEKYLYSTAFEIGEYIDTYHKLFMTGNSVEIVRNKTQPENEEPTCDKCEYFKIMYEPLQAKGKLGRARCEKYDLIKDFADREKLKELECPDRAESEEP